MNNIQNIKRGSWSEYLLLPDGRKMPIEISRIRYDSKLDLDTDNYINIGEKEYMSSIWPTINELINQGQVQKGSYLKEHTVRFDETDTLTLLQMSEDDFLKKHVPAIQKEFTEKGFDVSAEAILHNFRCWQREFKSGYRDETCHLFTPCCCNDLRFDATELDEHCKEWQTTYFG